MRLLLELKADVNAPDKKGETALTKAALAGHQSIVRLIREGYGAAAQDGVGGIVNSICANQKDQSLESIRLLDYRNGNKGSAQPGFGGAVAGGVTQQFGQQPAAFLPTAGAFELGGAASC